MRLELAFSPVRALVRSVEAFRVAPLLLLVGGTLLFLLTALDTFLSLVFGDVGELFDHIVRSPMRVLLSILFGGCCVKLVVQPLRAWVLSGYAGCMSAVAERREMSFRLLFSEHHWLSVFSTSLVASVLLSVVSLYLLGASLIAAFLDAIFLPEPATTLVLSLSISFLFLPFLAWVWLGMLAAPYVAALTGWTPTRSLRTSWRWAKRRRLRLMLFRITTWVASLVGLLGCGVGVVATWAIAEGAWLDAVGESLREDAAQRNESTVASSAASIETSSE